MKFVFIPFILSSLCATQPLPSIPQKDLFLSNPVYIFDIQFRPLCFQPISTTLNYAAEAFPLPLASPDWTIFNITPNYHFGFDLALGTAIHERNLDITLNWEYFHSTDSDAMSVTLDSNRVGPFFEIGPNATTYKKAKGDATLYLNALNLDSGIFINIGPFLQSRLFAGIKGVYIKQTIFSQFSSWDTTTFRSIKTPSSFFGCGPEIGYNFTYHIIKDFCLVGQGLAAFLVGNQKNSTSYTTLSPALPLGGASTPNIQTTTLHRDGIQGIVPEIDYRIGLAYLWNFCKHYAMNIEIGYEALLYINALYTIDISSEVVTPPVTPNTVGVFAKTFEKHPINFGLSGPYAMITLGF